jgi:hypothetical protein
MPKLRNLNLRLGAAALCAAAIWPAFGAHAAKVAPPADLASLEHWVGASLDCKADFLQNLQNRAFLERMKALGVKITSEWQEGDVPEGAFDLPQPVTFAGLAVTHIDYWGDSGAEFYGTVTASTDDVAKAVQAKPVPAKNRPDFDERTVAIRFTGGGPKGEHYPPAVFVRRAENGKGTEVGCHYFDG